jgi:hypothetical protein
MACIDHCLWIRHQPSYFARNIKARLVLGSTRSMQCMILGLTFLLGFVET